MARGVRDLRDLICVSRLTFRGSDDEACSDQDRLSEDFDRFSIPSDDNELWERPISTASDLSNEAKASDSGCVTNGYSVADRDDANVAKKKKKKKKKKQVVSIGHDLPKPAPLPPLQKSETSLSSSPDEIPAVEKLKEKTPSKIKDFTYEGVLCYLDASVLSEWVKRANESLTDLTQWCCQGDNFLDFANFLMTGMPDDQKFQLFHLEHGIFLDELSMVFKVGRESGKVTFNDLSSLCNAVFKEYPNKLICSKSSFLYLDYLNILSSERKEQFKDILTDVKVSTRNKQHAQWLLAMRAFALSSVWSAFVNFYRNLLSRDVIQNKQLVVSNTEEDQSLNRLFQAIRLGYSEVVRYYIQHVKLSVDSQDVHKRSLVFVAVMYNQDRILRYLITQTKRKADTNVPSDTGNCPLHAAANSGNIAVVNTLLKYGNCKLDPQNPQCDNATPLHLAVLNGHTEVVKALLEAGADRHIPMGNLSLVDVAREFGNKEILELLERSST